MAFIVIIAGFIPAIPNVGALCLTNRDGRDKRGHDNI